MTSPAQRGKIETAERDEVQENSTPRGRRKATNRKSTKRRGTAPRYVNLNKKYLTSGAKICYATSSAGEKPPREVDITPRYVNLKVAK